MLDQAKRSATLSVSSADSKSKIDPEALLGALPSGYFELLPKSAFDKHPLLTQLMRGEEYLVMCVKCANTGGSIAVSFFCWSEGSSIGSVAMFMFLLFVV